jgi:hypothetical protein
MLSLLVRSFISSLNKGDFATATFYVVSITMPTLLAFPSALLILSLHPPALLSLSFR